MTVHNTVLLASTIFYIWCCWWSSLKVYSVANIDMSHQLHLTQVADDVPGVVTEVKHVGFSLLRV